VVRDMVRPILVSGGMAAILFGSRSTAYCD
jgi:hypothetical protein